jgi:hypothetical protein
MTDALGGGAHLVSSFGVKTRHLDLFALRIQHPNFAFARLRPRRCITDRLLVVQSSTQGRFEVLE